MARSLLRRRQRNDRQIRMTLLRVGTIVAACWRFASSAQSDDSPWPRVAQAGVTGDPAVPADESESAASFVKLDRNHDGALDAVESKGAVADFDTADADGNGRLDATEYAAARADAEQGGSVEYPGGDGD
jgi:EF hand domain-containing protein